MELLIDAIKDLQNNDINDVIKERIHDFREIRKQSIDIIFKELCFCIMTANCSAERCIKVHETIDDGFLNLSENQLAKAFKKNKYRFPNIRSRYIVEARQYKKDLELMIRGNIGTNELREWLVHSIKGLGYKEASHFLRNIGYADYAIIDFHIIDTLVKFGIIKKPKTLTKKKYLEIENILRLIVKNLNLNLDELDLFLWYLETGKVLK
ncbi:MAG: N-glycosylase/DNA lyase [Promethearchaeota archaeon]